MFRKLLLGTCATFALWTGLDFFFHGFVLGEYYQVTAQLWRPIEEAKMVLNSVVVLSASFLFTMIYTALINPKSVQIGFGYGLLFGAAAGAAMGYGSYAFMPVPHFMAFIWFVNGLVQGMAGGTALGLLIKDDGAEMDKPGQSLD